MRTPELLLLLLLVSPLVVHGQTGVSRGRRSATPRSHTDNAAYKELAGTFHGALKDITGKEIVIQNDENQTVSIRRTRKTKFLKDDRNIKPSEIPLDTPVTIEASEDIDLKPMAITVTVDSAAKKTAGK